MNQRYKEALSEVEFVLGNLEPSEVAKIPKNFRDFITENKCKWYEITDDNNLKEETLAILAIIYRKFLAPVEERAELEREYQEKLKKEKEELKQMREKNESVSTTEIKYNFAQPSIPKEPESVQEKNELMEYKSEKWYMKLFNKLKSMISR